jgi:hypothetical protein
MLIPLEPISDLNGSWLIPHNPLWRTAIHLQPYLITVRTRLLQDAYSGLLIQRSWPINRSSLKAHLNSQSFRFHMQEYTHNFCNLNLAGTKVNIAQSVLGAVVPQL